MVFDRQMLGHDLIRDEGLRLKPYRCPAGDLTIGVGRNLDSVGISEPEARHLLAGDITRVSGELDRALPWWRDLPEPQQRALANMAFNLGLSRLLGFEKMLAALEKGDATAAAAEALNSRWARQVGPRAQRIATLIRKGNAA